MEKVFVVGGTEVYRNAMESERCERIYYTAIKRQFECDTWFPMECLGSYGSVNVEKTSSIKVEDGSEVEIDFIVRERS